MEILKRNVKTASGRGIRILLGGALTLLLFGCEGLTIGGHPDSAVAPPQEKAVAIDAVKLIRPEIERGDDESTFNQNRYTIGPSARLLLRYESLSEKKNVLADQPLRLRVFAYKSEDSAGLMSSARVCPITRPWMMAASWSAAFPFRGGEWVPGGAIDESECVKAQAADVSSGLCGEAGAICFDLTRWYKIWILEKPEAPENYGFALISEQPVTVFGDAAAAKSPRIQWFESDERL